MAKRKADPIQEVLSKHVTTVSECGMLRELNYHEHDLVRRAADAISGSTDLAPLRLYRGESKTNLRRQLLPSSVADIPDYLLYSRLFLFGEKARHFSRDTDDAIVQRPWLRGITDTRAATFEWLFDRIHRIIGYRYRRVQRFRRENPEFTAFFSDPALKAEFRRRVMKLFQTGRAQVRDYYLYFLHTYGRKGIDRETLLVSTSECRTQAKRFQGRGDQGVLLYIFLPRRYLRNAVSSRLGRAAEFAGLPSYHPGADLYAKQREVSLRGAIFPHYIFGVEDNATKQFIVNPHLLQMPQPFVTQIHRRGIKVDQRAFEPLFHESGFYRSVIGGRAGRLYSGTHSRGFINSYWRGS
jgi:hypothetical protein